MFVNIIPMAGQGSRFANEGYLLPKPLIPVSGSPMIAQVIKRLPKADKWIFILRPEHVESYKIDTYLRSLIPEAIIMVDHEPKGQAASAMLALSEVHEEDELFFSACDNAFLYNENEFNQLRKRDNVDSIVWTFTKDELLRAKPEAWGWIRLDEDGETISDMSVKVPVSDDPFNDHAVVASFYFKRACDFISAYNAMVAANHTINGEYYIDTMPIYMKKIGKKSIIFPVDLYVSWGKPADLYSYQKEEYLYNINQSSSQLWHSYFTNK